MSEDLKAVTAERDALRASVIGSAFAGSRYVAERMTVHPDMARASFGGAFTVENGRVVAKDASGGTIYSRANPGEPAGFDEALEALVDAYPHKQQITKAAIGGAGGFGFGVKMSRTEFDRLLPSRRMEHVRAGGVVVD